MSEILKLTNITKVFPGVKALSSVDFTLNKGEIHVLMGENGAGKSTLIKVITGVYQADGGTVVLDGAEIRPQSPLDAGRLGISTVYQEVNLAPNLTVAENICLGREQFNAFGLNWSATRKRAEAALKRLGIEVDVRRPLGSCSVAIQQMTAIARALDIEAKVLVLDEPTSSLDKDEVQQLFSAMRGLRGQGIGIVFVTHFLDQVYEVSDRITVLRNGSLVGAYNTAELPKFELVSKMIGRDASELENHDRATASGTGESVLEAKGLRRQGMVENSNFAAVKGEVVGLAGLLGSGRTESLRLAYGLDSLDAGTVSIGGQTMPKLKPQRAIKEGLGLCPEDRKLEGIVPDLSVRENMMLVLQSRQGWFKLIDKKKQYEVVDKFIASLKIATSDREKPIKELSGGNQQKVLLARWLAAHPKLLMLDEPTRGIDVGARFEIEQLIQQLAKEGTSFLLVSSELDELIRTCSRIFVMRDRTTAAELTGTQISEEAIMSAMAGGHE